MQTLKANGSREGCFIPDATAFANYTLLDYQSFTLDVSNQPSGFFFNATMSNKPGLQITCHIENEGFVWMIYNSIGDNIGGFASDYLDDKDVLTLTFL